MGAIITIHLFHNDEGVIKSLFDVMRNRELLLGVQKIQAQDFVTLWAFLPKLSEDASREKLKAQLGRDMVVDIVYMDT